MSTPWKLLSGSLTLAFVVVLGAFSQWPVHEEPEGAVVRLSWRMEPVRVEECRTLTDEELADVPAHMRRAEECVGDFVDYELVLVVDGREALVDTIAPSGLRRDRPVYVLHDESVEAGRRRVEVSFSALLPADYVSEDGPTTLRWTGSMALEPGEVGLVTLGPAERQLVRVGEERP